jgi:VCBS repeat-containing protein
VVATGTTTGLQSNNAALLAMLDVGNADVIGNAATNGTIAWAFNSGSESFNHLAQGEQLVLTYTVRASDSASGIHEQTLVITLTGSNDKPTLSIATPADFVEDGNAVAQSLSATGNVAFADLDRSDLIDVTYLSAQAPVWSAGQLPAALAQSLLSGFSVSATNVSVTTPVSWTYSHAATDLDFLGAGESISFSYDVIVTDAQGEQITAPVAFTLTGSNDAPVLASVSAIELTDTANQDSLASVAGSLSSSDLDSTDSATYSVSGSTASSRSAYDRQVVGAYGTLYLHSSTGAYEYVPDDLAINALTANAIESFTLTVSDRSSTTASRVLDIRVTAANDTPELAAHEASASFTDNAGDDNFVPLSGNLSGSDRDTGARLSYALQGSQADTSRSGFDLSKTGRFGTLYLNSSTGAYTYVPNDSAIEGQAEGSRSQDDFVFEVSDGSSSQTTGFTAWVVGAGDPPVFSNGDDTVALTEANATLTASGNLTLTDSDLSDSVRLSKAVTVGGSTTATLPAASVLLDMLSINPSTLLDDASTTTGSVSWGFNSGSEHFNNLAAGETLVLTYTISATDTGSPALTGSTTVTVTITGTNDGPVLDVPNTITLSDTASDDTLPETNGQLNATDLDHNAALVYSLSHQVIDNSRSGYDRSQTSRLGTLYLNSGTGAYLYVPNETVIEALKEDSSDTFSVRVSDGTAIATQSLSVRVSANNDTPVLGAVSAIAQLDTSANDSFADITGTLSSSDRDGDGVTYAITGQSSENHVIDSVTYTAKRVGQYGTLYLNAHSGAYRLVANDSAIEGLKANTSELFSIVASDGSASDAGVLTVNITASNDLPALSASVTAIGLTDTAGDDRFAATTGVLTVTERDAPESATYAVTGGNSDTSRSGYDLSKVGTYGTLLIQSSTGAYEYVPHHAAINALSANASESFTLTVTDGSSAAASQILTVSLTAANDTPEAVASLSSTTYVDTGASDTFSAVTGSLSGNDRDSAAVLSYAIQGGTLESNTINTVIYDQKLVGTYGTLYLNSATRAYTYVPDDTAINALSANTRDEFTFVVSDGTATHTTGFTAWLVGAGDQPVISEGADRAAMTESNAALTVSGSITVTDNDLSDQVNLTRDLTVSGTSTGRPPSTADLLAMFTLNSPTVLSDGSSITAPVGWTFNSGDQRFDYLAEGETLVLTYSISATDTGSPALFDTSSVVITITGTNDGPVLVLPSAITLTDTASDNSFSPVTGNFVGSDLDHDAALVYSLSAQVADSSRQGFDLRQDGRFGTLFLNSLTGAYAYVANDAAIEGLKANASEAFSVHVSDGTSRALQTLNVDISATNDTPTLSASLTALTYNDSAVTDRFNSATGSLASADRDTADSATYSLTNGLADSSRAGYNLRQAGNYGVLFLHSQTGAYLYVPNDAAINALTGAASENFALRVTDGSAATVNQTLTITLNGTNDVPVVTNSAQASAGSVTEAGHSDDGSAIAGSASATGTLSVSDVDASASRSWSLQGSPSTSYGTIALDASTGVWTYTLDNTLASTQALQEGQVVTQTYVARATDDFGAYVDQTLTVTITGSNDVPVVSSPAAQAIATVKESGHDDNGMVLAGTPAVTRQITAGDVDRQATQVYELEGTVSSRYGRIALDRNTGEWTYTLDNTLVTTQNLREGQRVFERYTVRVTDDRGAQVRETITVTVEGSNDVPTVVGTLAAEAYLQGEQLEVATAQLFTDIDVDAGAFSFSAQLPPGLQIDAQSGVISGAGTRPGDYVIVIRATDAQGAWAETTWDVRINAPARDDGAGQLGNGSSRNNPVIDGGNSASGNSAAGKGQGTFGADVLGGGIPGFGSTIPVPVLPDAFTSNFDGSAAGAGNLAPANSNLADSNSGNNAPSAPGTGLSEGASSGNSGNNAEAGAGSSGASNGQTNATQTTAESTAQVQEQTDASVGANGQLQLGTRDAGDAPSGNEEPSTRSVERVNVSVNANGQVSLKQEIPQANESPTGIMLVEVSQQQTGLQIEIADFRRGQVAQYRATLLNGDPLPSWIRVDAATGKVTAMPGNAVSLIELKFIAEDANGSTRTLEIKVDLRTPENRAETGSGAPPATHARAAFGSQLASHHRQWDGYGEQLLSVFTE